MDKNATADRGLWGALEAMIVGFVVAGAAAAVLLTNFNGQGRLWDKLLGRNDEFPPAPAIVATRVTPPDPGSGHIMLVADGFASQTPDAAPAAAAKTAPKPAPAKKSWVKHISGQLAEYSITGPASQHSSASASAETAPSAPAAGSAAPAAAVAAVQAPSPAAPAASPSYVNYGSSSRSDIMSSASGPVYNFSGKKK